MALAQSSASDVCIEPIRFQPLGPDVFGKTQPQCLLAAIDEAVEPLVGLTNQHVVSIQSFSASTLLQLFRLAAKYESLALIHI